MKIRRSLLKDTVTVETYSGESAVGPIYADPVSVPVYAEAQRRMVRNIDGDEVVSELTLHVHPNEAADFTPESLVTFDGRVCRVITAQPMRMRGYTTHSRVACS